MFIAVLDANGSDLLFSTYLGGSKEEVGTDIALDKDGHIMYLPTCSASFLLLALTLLWTTSMSPA